jgi:thiamine biosynthesis protein ThiS
MNVTVNGVQRKLGGEPTLLELLEQLELDPRTVVVEHNQRIVRRPVLTDVQLAEGDVVEVVHFVGGG